jgi:hypothetical protein
MITTLQRSLFTIAAALILADFGWALLGRFQVDLLAYCRIALLALALAAAGAFYQEKRHEPALAAMMLGASFLCAFSAAASMLNYFLLTFHGPRIDTWLAKIDRSLGFDWAAVMAAMAGHPLLNSMLFFSYNSVLPEIALMTVALAWAGKAESTYRFCLCVAVGALIAIFIWALMPSVGTQALFTLPPQIAAKLNLAVQGDYGIELNRLLRDGPGLITPSELRGLIAFPSYHGVLALIVAWYAREIPRLFWPLLAINALVLVATPVQGGHYLVDVFASFPVAMLSIVIASRLGRGAEVRKAFVVVNKEIRNTLSPVP